ncbi:MAG: hypothetical protein DRO88_13670, partial [Promethearchaeia archaeon]
LIDFCIIAIIIIIILIITVYNVIKIIDPDEKTIRITRRRRFLTIPIANMRELEVVKNETSGYFELLLPTLGYAGDLSVIKYSLKNDNSYILFKTDKETILNEFKSSLFDFLEKFPI